MANKKQKTVLQLLEELGERVRTHRWEERLTLDTLSSEAKCSTVTLAQIEKNTLESVSIKKLIGIANAVGCNLSISLEELPKKKTKA